MCSVFPGMLHVHRHTHSDERCSCLMHFLHLHPKSSKNKHISRVNDPLVYVNCSSSRCSFSLSLCSATFCRCWAAPCPPCRDTECRMELLLFLNIQSLLTLVIPVTWQGFSGVKGQTTPMLEALFAGDMLALPQALLPWAVRANVALKLCSSAHLYLMLWLLKKASRSEQQQTGFICSCKFL